MTDGKLNFDSTELAYLNDTDFLLTKIDIGFKIETLLGEVEKVLLPIIEQVDWPQNVLVKSGKISKGEMYQGLPYYVLDFPRRFSKDEVFAFRTMCWWGNFFSATLHLSGSYLENSRDSLINHIESIRASDAFICVNSTPWEYHYQSDNYLQANKFERSELENLFTSKPFIKISYKWDLDTYASLPPQVLQVFQQTLEWVNN